MADLQLHPDAAALIFDLDGTLADTMPLHYQAWRDAVAACGHHYPEEVFYELAGMPCTAILPKVNARFGWNLDEVAVAADKERRFLELIGRIRPIEPVMSIVRAQRGRMPMAIGTGGLRRVVELTIRALGLEGVFAATVAAEDVARHKPEPDTFLRCAELLGVEPGRCQVFEDGELGLVAAARAGMIVTDVRPSLLGKGNG